MYPAPEAGTFSVDGQQFDLMDGVVGLTLGKTRRFDESTKVLWELGPTQFAQSTLFESHLRLYLGDSLFAFGTGLM